MIAIASTSPNTGTAGAPVRKALRHSGLRALGQVRVMLTGHPRPSRYRGQADYVCLQVRGDETRYCLAVENPTVRDQLGALPLHTWISIQAVGRDAEARLHVAGATPQAPQDAPHAPSPASPAPEPLPAGG